MIRLLVIVLAGLAGLGTVAVGGVVALFYHAARDLPDHEQLATYEPPVMSRVHAGNGRLLTELAVERRVFVPIEAMPKRLVDAFIAAEDKNFFEHAGIDFTGIMRAVVTNIERMGQSRRPVGASTITQQVAKNFLLTNEVSFERKIKEAILAFRIERALSKDRILELYLNEVYLGFGAYGVAAAALNYFNKSLNELTLGEAAYIAALPKAPNNYHPVRLPDQARARRDYVVGRMFEDGLINREEAAEATTGPVEVRRRNDIEPVRADYFVEEVRRQLVERYGEKRTYGGGLSVRTTLDPRLQAIGDEALRNGLIAYDRRHGWRGPIGQIDSLRDWQKRLPEIAVPVEMPGWRKAVVLALASDRVEIGLEGGEGGHIPVNELRWARRTEADQRLGPLIRGPQDVVATGDVILVEALSGQGPSFGLRQIPDVSGGLVALDPHTGRVLAMAGGLSFAQSQFNRATQAQRQPGSAFKTFAYLAALEAGYTPVTKVVDGPIEIDQGPGLPPWRPTNYNAREVYGPTTLRVGLEKSRNLMTVRLAQEIGIDRVGEASERFGVFDRMPRVYSMVLGAGETTLMRMATAYATIVNGGRRITPTLIDRVQDRTGRTIFRHDQRPCPDCRAATAADTPPHFRDDRERVTDPVAAFQMVSMLQGVVERGTGARIASLRRPLAGKTGTTNDSFDAWFIGFSPDLVVATYVGFDNPRTLGDRETGGSVAAPIFQEFMGKALDGRPAVPFRTPPGVRLVRINAATGELPNDGDRQVILEAFRPGTEPGSGYDIHRGGAERDGIIADGSTGAVTGDSGRTGARGTVGGTAGGTAGGAPGG
ncbi:MAG: penicillin-binding protein 1A, partial [Alphaproteobacteria bacterium]|nr:penicillin-binding protein 1A [Alphaproteobacteria bacterium]